MRRQPAGRVLRLGGTEDRVELPDRESAMREWVEVVDGEVLCFLQLRLEKHHAAERFRGGDDTSPEVGNSLSARAIWGGL